MLWLIMFPVFFVKHFFAIGSFQKVVNIEMQYVVYVICYEHMIIKVFKLVGTLVIANSQT